MPKDDSKSQEDKTPINKAKEPRSILLFDFAELEEMVLSTPAYEAVKRRYPTSLLTLLTFESNVPFIAGDPSFYEVVGVPVSRGGNPPFVETLRTIMALRRRGYELAVDLNGSAFNAFLLFLARVPKRVGALRDNGNHYLTDAFEIPDYSNHPLLRRLSLLEKMGCATRRRRPVIYPLPRDERYIEDLLAATGLDGGDQIMVIHPSAEWDGYLPPSKLARIIDQMTDHTPGLVVFLSGSPETKTYVEETVNGCILRPSVFHLGLAHFAAFVERCDLFLGDEGIHTTLATAVGTRVIGMYLGRRTMNIQEAIPRLNADALLEILEREFLEIKGLKRPKRRFHESEEFRRMRRENNLFLHTSP